MRATSMSQSEPSHPDRLLTCLNEWSLTRLPELNRGIMGGLTSPTALIDELNGTVLNELPPPESFSPTETKQALVHLGFYGASVARHCQEHDPRLKDEPNKSFDRLAVGAESVPFQSYFARLADHSGTGHPHRDTYASISRWNTPTAEVFWHGQLIARIPGAFSDSRTRTYTSDPGEVAFFNLIKKSEALELAANRLLIPIWDGSVDLSGPTALEHIQQAALLLAVVHRLNLDFASLPPEAGLRPDFFLDTMRQFAVHWTIGDVPPSGAQDPEYLIRDFLIGINYPDYAQHVFRVFPALLEEERTFLSRVMTSKPIPEVALERLGLDPVALSAMSPSAQVALVNQHPILAALHQLLFINFRIGSSHLMLSKKFLFKPAYARDEAGIEDNFLVSRYSGTTGMIERLLEALTKARKQHALCGLNHLSHAELSSAAGIQQLPTIASEQVDEYVRQ